MDKPEKEPAPTIRAELARRRMTVGRLLAATEISEYRLQRRLNNPGTFQLGEVARIATALDITPSQLLDAWFVENQSEVAR